MSGVPHIEIHESVEELKDLMHQQRQADDRERIQALLFAQKWTMPAGAAGCKGHRTASQHGSSLVGLLSHWRGQPLA